MKKKAINSLSESFIKRKNEKRMNEDIITQKKLEILQVQRQQEFVNLEFKKKKFNS